MSNLLINGEFDFTSLGPNAKKALADLFYPVGFIMTVRNNTDYSNYCGCVWTKLESNRVLWSSTTVGTIAEDTIAAGLPNIAGSAKEMIFRKDGVSTSGALSTSENYEYWDSNNGGSYQGRRMKVSFDASRSSSIYGKSNTVQPPAIKAVMWQRIG